MPRRWLGLRTTVKEKISLAIARAFLKHRNFPKLILRGHSFQSFRSVKLTSLNPNVPSRSFQSLNLKFHFLPTQDTREKPASFGQIAENFVFREKLLLPNRRENQRN